MLKNSFFDSPHAHSKNCQRVGLLLLMGRPEGLSSLTAFWSVRLSQLGQN